MEPVPVDPIPSGSKGKEKDDDGEDMVVETPVRKGRIRALREKKDFSAEVDELLPQYVQIAKDGKLEDAVELLLSLEKKCRNGQDAFSTAKVSCAILQICFDAKDLETLNNSLILLGKRRGQLKHAIQEVVRKGIEFIDGLSEEAQQIALIATLRTVTEGKIFVEVERALLTRKLAAMKEASGQIAEAADILQEVQVETFGQMTMEEKLDYILEQVRLCLAKQDYIRARIISNKVSTKVLLKDEFQALKLRFYKLMVTYYSHEHDNLNVCKSYHSIYNTKSILDDKESWSETLKLVVAFVVMSKFDNEQSDLMHRVYEDKRLYDLPIFRSLLKAFVTIELIDWEDLKASYEGALNELQPFKDDGDVLWDDLRSRVVEHNIRVISTYYDCITFKRLCELLALPSERAEKFISDLVSTGAIWARIDRPNGTISFTDRKEASAVLNDWSHDVGDMLGIIEKTCHLIQREQMVHGKGRGGRR